MRLFKWLLALFVALCIAGTAFAIAEPENSLAAPFRGFAVKTLEVYSSMLEFFRNARTVTATYEHSTVENGLKLLMIDEGLKSLPVVEVPTNNMSEFPSREFPLYPDYVTTKTSSFSYTINNKGELLTAQTDVPIDPGLEQIYTATKRLQNLGRPKVFTVR